MNQMSRVGKILLILCFKKALVHFRVIPKIGHWFGHGHYGTGEDVYERVMEKCSNSKK